MLARSRRCARRCCAGSRYSLYASSSTTSTFSRHRGDERAQRLRRDPGARRIVRIGDEHDARLRRDRRAHRRQVVRVVAGRHLDARRAARLRGERIDDERVAANRRRDRPAAETPASRARARRSIRCRARAGSATRAARAESAALSSKPSPSGYRQISSVAAAIAARTAGARPARILVRRELHDVCSRSGRTRGQARAIGFPGTYRPRLRTYSGASSEGSTARWGTGDGAHVHS